MSSLVLIITTTVVHIKMVEQVDMLQRLPVSFSIPLPLKFYVLPYSDLGFNYSVIGFGV